MKKIFVLIILVFFASNSYSQLKIDLVGVWRITVQAGEKPTTPTYALLNADGSYLWGTDSTGSDPDGKASIGTWDLTLQKEIKIIPVNKTDKIRYYGPMGSDNMYKYKYYEDNGQKVLDKQTDMSVFMQKIG